MLGPKVIDGVVIAYVKTIFYSSYSIIETVIAILSLLMIVFLPESCETILSSLLSYDCLNDALEFLLAEKSKFSFG